MQQRDAGPRIAVLLLLAAGAAANCTDPFGAVQLTPRRAKGNGFAVDGVLLTDPLTITLWLRVGPTEVQTAPSVDSKLVWECSSGGASVVSLSLAVNETTSLLTYTTPDGSVSAGHDSFADFRWHYVAIVHAYSTLRFYGDGPTLLHETNMPSLTMPGRWATCFVGGSSDPKKSTESAASLFLGSLHDLRVYPQTALTLSRLLVDAGVESLQGSGSVLGVEEDPGIYSAFCTVKCAGPYSSIGPVLNVGYTAALQIEQGNTHVIQGYITLLSVPQEVGRRVVALIGGGEACEGGLQLYVFRGHEVSGRFGFGVDVVGEGDGLETRADFVPGETYAVRVVLGGAQPWADGDTAVSDQPVRVTMLVDSSRVTTFRRWRVAGGSISLLSACHQNAAHAAHAIVELFTSGCDTLYPDLPLRDPSSKATEPIRLRNPEMSVDTQLHALWVPTQGRGERYTEWRKEAHGWSATEKEWTVRGNATGILVVPGTQQLLACTEHGVFVSTDGGGTWSTAHEAACGHLAMLPDGLVIAVCMGDGGVLRSEDYGVHWEWVAVDPSPPAAAVAEAQVAVFPNGVACVTARLEGQPRGKIWVSSDAGLTWESDYSAELIIGWGDGAACLPHVAWKESKVQSAGGRHDTSLYTVVLGCGRTVAVATVESLQEYVQGMSLYWEVIPRVRHGMARVSAVLPFPSGAGLA
ncbi:hypothetical protein DIPPA_07547 [Diplonema papillatum]|nr:hypothetical protein DIPPA_07547 [Diplonema papillatum]